MNGDRDVGGLGSVTALCLCLRMSQEDKEEAWRGRAHTCVGSRSVNGSVGRRAFGGGRVYGREGGAGGVRRWGPGVLTEGHGQGHGAGCRAGLT